jgi:flagellar hook assembly protein FlgD
LIAGRGLRRRIRGATVLPALLGLAGAFGASVPARAGAAPSRGTTAAPIERLLVEPNPFSPNGDGRLDTTAIEVTLSEPVASARVEIRPTGSAALLRSFPRSGSPGTTRLGWDGRDFEGRALADGSYDVVAIAARELAVDSVATAVHLDTKPLAILSLSVSPNPVAPGIAGRDTAALALTTGPPGAGDVASASLALRDSADAPIVLAFARAPGTPAGWIAKWDGFNGKTGASRAPAPDGVYDVTVRTSDAAGNEAGAAAWAVDLDRDPPVVEILEPPGLRARTIVEVVRGTARDRNGATVTARVDSASVEPATTPLEGGGVAWSIAVPETLRREGSFQVEVTARDLVGRIGRGTETITIDLTPPATPEPDPLPAVVETAELNVSGRAPGADSVHVYRNDAPAGSTTVPPSGIFRRRITLAPGLNRIVFQASDLAGNLSLATAPVIVEYVERPGFGAPAPFRPGDHFEVNLPSEARSVRIRILTLEGRLVRTLLREAEAREYEIAWDLEDEDARTVRNGPYLCVMTARMADGGERTERKGILVDAD